MSDFVWKGKRALVSGASGGLGKYLSLELARQGAHLHLVGRDIGRLESTKEEVIAAGAASATSLSIDVLEEAADSVIAQSLNLKPTGFAGGLDLLINAIGQSDRGYLMQLSESNLVELFRTNVVAAHQMTKACLPTLKLSKGCVVNIGSLASKVATPGLGGYAVCKFGLAAMSQQLRLELAGDGVHVMLVCPGPIRRDDAGNRYDAIAKERGLEEQLRKPGGGASLKSLDPKKLAREILHAAAIRSIDLTRPSKVKWLSAIAMLWPSLGDWILKRSLRSK